MQPSAASSAFERIQQLDWDFISNDLDTRGSALMDRVLSPGECRTLADLYSDEGIFRSRVVMARHGFGQGEYKYFSYPLPELIADLRTTLYMKLAPVANATASAAFAQASAIRLVSFFMTRSSDEPV